MAPNSWIPPPPPDPSTLQNPPPFLPHPLTSLRSGKIKKVWGKEIESAIYKVPLSGPARITEYGISTDERAWPAHQGLNNALLHYSSSHYKLWKDELPESAHFFNVGAFGENLYSEDIDEKSICIGDKISIGEVVVQVSENRAPCYKLNHRFETKDMSKRAQTLFRTGWLYRILKTGVVWPGDMITLIERPHPEWTVARIMYYLYIEKDNVERMKEIVELEPLGIAIKNIFRGRLERGTAEDQDGRMYGGELVSMDTWNEYRIIAKRRETSKITAFVLEAVEGQDKIAAVEPGSHVRLKLGGKLVRAYSVVGGTTKRFELGIALDAKSRGGSKFMHEQTKVGGVLTVGPITASFPLAKEADRHVIIAGGIGITAFLAALKQLHESGETYELHFAVAEEIPFKEHIAALGANANMYNKSRGQKLRLNEIISRADSNTHFYCCGPQRLMDGVEATAKQYGVPDAAVHMEQFAVSTSGDPFTAELRESKKTVEVGGTETLLDALRKVGMDVDSSCEVGNCGACRVNVCSGRIEHKGTGLLEHEKEAMMLSCVSRGIGRIVLDL